MTYPFNSILINGREVTIASIISTKALPRTEFESHTFTFIRQWLTNHDDFSITTSGSTGKPKTIPLTRAQMRASARMTVNFLALKKNDRALVCLNTQFIAGRMMLVRAFEAGLHIIVQEPSANPLQGVVSDIDFIALVPLQFQSIIDAGKMYVEKLNRMKAIIIGGAPVHDSLKEKIKKIKSPVFSTYGMTETISHVALQRLNGEHGTEKYLMLPGIHIKKDDRGCLVIDAPYLSNKITTNDLVDITSAAEFQWLGRWDNIINTGGLKIIPEEVESKISYTFTSLSIDANFFIHSLPDERLGNKIILVIETEKHLNKEEIISSVKQSLSKYEVPKDIITIPQFSYTQTGKINRTESMLKAGKN